MHSVACWDLAKEIRYFWRFEFWELIDAQSFFVIRFFTGANAVITGVYVHWITDLVSADFAQNNRTEKKIEYNEGDVCVTLNIPEYFGKKISIFFDVEVYGD